MKTIFTFDLERGYQTNYINNYRKIIQRLASTYPWNHEIRQETDDNSHDKWITIQGEDYQEYFDYYYIPVKSNRYLVVYALLS